MSKLPPADSPLEQTLDQARPTGIDDADIATADELSTALEHPNRELERTITIRTGAFAETVSAACGMLRAENVEIYDRGGMLVRPMRVVQPEHGVRRPSGAIVLVAVDVDWLSLTLARVTRWRRLVRGKDNEPHERAADPPRLVARTIANVPDAGDWRSLRAIVRHPILTDSGAWIGTSGYHDGLLLDLQGEWPAPGESRADAETALRTLRHHVRHYPWTSAADESVAMSLLVTAIMRPVLNAAPMHALDAPAAGTGKSLLADVAAILATGSRAAVMDYGRDADEAAKRLDGILLAGDPVIVIDNIETPLEGAALCQTLTQLARRVRPLGASRIVTVPCTALIIATGNNLSVSGDLGRRTIVCRLDAQSERPELRKIPQDLIAESSAQRAELVAACQTVSRAYLAAGAPTLDIAPLGSYGEWTRMVRAPLIWLGMPDPAEVIERTRADDPSREAVSAVLSAWHDAFGQEAATTQEAIVRAQQHQSLWDALAMVALRRGKLDAKALGYWLRKFRDTRCDGLTLRRREGRAGTARWAVSGGDGGDGGDVPAPRGRACARNTLMEPGQISPPSPPSPPCPHCDGEGCRWCEA